jgi:hypothetical protein
MKQDEAKLNITPNDNHNWDNIIITRDCEGANVMYFIGWKEGEYHHMDTIWLPQDLMYKEIPLTLYVNNEQVVKGEEAWDYKSEISNIFHVCLKVYMFWMWSIC